ncbi:MAG: PEGA domain-containing protein [Sandaracinaceae bacterium]|nr:PEGA domain-containing protein [Sandaracinaceae bacterium]
MAALIGLAASQSTASAQPRRVAAEEDESAPPAGSSDESEETSAPAQAPAGDEDEGGRAAPRTARAEPATEPVRVYVIAVPMEEGLEAVAQRSGAAARASLREIPNVEWQAADRLFLGYDESAVPTLARARERLQAGREAYLNLELGQAIELLTASVADFDAAAAALEDPNDLGQALLFLGASLAFEGRTRDATRIFTRLHVQMPHVQPDPNLFNPDVISRFEAARPRGAASSSIVVESDPPGAIAYVDFLARGVTPITVQGLHAGDHIVRVTRAGAIPSVQPLTVAARRSVSTSAMLVDEEATAGLVDALNQVREADVASISPGTPIHDVASLLGVERIGVIRASASETEGQVELELLVFDVASGRRLVRGAGSAPVAVGELEPAVDRLVSGALEAAIHARATAEDEAARRRREQQEAELPPVLEQPPPQGPSVFEDPIFWVVVGGVLVAAGVGVGIGVGVASQGPPLGTNTSGTVVLEF